MTDSTSEHWNQAVAEAEFDPLLKELPEQYDLKMKVRQGGMGAIYSARNRYTNADLAIKILLPKYAADEDMRQRFITEAKAASALKHPGICQVRDFGITKSKMPYLVMDWLDGITLHEWVETRGPLAEREAIAIFIQIAAAIGNAHKMKVIHRDLKPEHVVLCKNEHHENNDVRIVDFGIAKLIHDESAPAPKEGLTMDGMVIGTPLYMSPQQIKGLKLDGATDIYSLGCLMYFSMAGCPPFEGDNYMDVMYKHVNNQPPEFPHNVKVSADLTGVIFRAMEKEPEDRYKSMDEVISDLKKLSKGVSVERKALSHHRAKAKQNWITVGYFVGGFIAMYFISMLVQAAFDAADKNAPTKPAEVERKN
ncbi:MAG TPA: serine/threonine protein kinase [Candidatus Melainabacteria bacterium]|nr:serine/threonine protein kinase [Candidatus Melainabacteria bacterium]HIN65011.1 serine/threonine protein kinase [Candidatus Obscuribacterales bacterium]